jgi:hypothetical protein
VAEEEVARERVVVEDLEAVPALARRRQQLGVVLELELAGQTATSASTSTSSSRAAASARWSASTFVSATAIT